MFGDAKVRLLAGACLLFALLCVSNVAVFAQGTAQITGKITDSKTKAPLGFANIVLAGTTKGAMSLDNGSYNVTGVPAGTYTVKVMMMGYKTIERPGVIINAGELVELDFPLEQTIVATTQVINVVGEREMVDVTSSDIRQTVSEEQVKEMPVDNAIDAIALKTGIVKTGDDLHARGGRTGEIQMQIDGVPVDDPLGGGAMGVGMLGTSGSEFIAGGMDAEYGNAQSGVINVQTKEGGPVFGGEFRYFTDDFGRQDKTYTNFDRVSLGLGGPTPWRSVRYYISGEAAFSDGENNTVEPREETKVTDWLKWRERMNHSYNLQSKVTWNNAPFKVTGEAIIQKSTFDTYYHNWNIQGYTQKQYLFQSLRATQSGVDVFEFGGIWSEYEGEWLNDVNDQTKQPNPRFVVVEQLIRDPETNEQQLITYYNFRAVDIPRQGSADPITILWDEAIVNENGEFLGQYRPWVLFEGFQFPGSGFSNFAEDSSYVWFNSASRTPETENTNLQLKLGFNHNISDDLLYTVNLSRIAFNQKRTVNGKEPAEYSTAGLPTDMPDGSQIRSGVSQSVWYTDSDNPYFVTAYDYPFYRDRQSVTWLIKSDLTSERVRGHRLKGGFMVLYNDLHQDDRTQPGLQRLNADGSVQQGLNVNQFRNFNPEAALYIQDKWEYEGMVVNGGVRFEYFSTGNNKEILINSAEVDPQVEKHKFNWSPRLGFAFPDHRSGQVLFPLWPIYAVAEP